MNNFGYVLATKMLVEGNKKIHFMYREQPDNEQDSGWRFFCGCESAEYANNPKNIFVCDIETILELDNSVKQYLDSPANSAFEREIGREDFKRISPSDKWWLTAAN